MDTTDFIKEYSKIKKPFGKRGNYKRTIVKTERNLEIVAAYKKHKKLQLAANELGITRERVRQVTNKFLDDPEIVAIKNQYDHSNERCLICNRSFTQVRYAGKGICGSCKSYQSSKSRVHRRRNIHLPKNCKGCKTEFTGEYPTKRKSGDLCDICFSKTSHYKKLQRNWRQRHKEQVYKKCYKYYKEVWAPKNKEKLKAYRVKIYAKNREKILEKCRKRYQNNIEHYRERSRQEYIKHLLPE